MMVDQESENLTDCCPFYLHFVQTEPNRWVLHATDKHMLSAMCPAATFPDICAAPRFLKHFIRKWACDTRQDVKDVKRRAVTSMLKEMGFRQDRQRITRALKELQGKSKTAVTHADQMVEDYVEHLNSLGHLSVLLYSNKELIVPIPEREKEEDGPVTKRCMIDGDAPAYCCPARLDCYWDVLPEREVGSETRCVRMTFEAVSDACHAFQYSLPVICIDACKIKFPYVQAVLMTATFQTTDGHLLSMCFGTAPSESDESWCFFLGNLRHAIHSYCENIDWSRTVFMSDRHKSIIKGVRLFFPESKQLHCVFHLLQNIFKPGMSVTAFWKAVEAPTRAVFEEACRNLPRERLIDPELWSRFAIAESDCRRYRVRVNNWSEGQNSVFEDERAGPVLSVLIDCFKYTTGRVKMFIKRARATVLSMVHILLLCRQMRSTSS